MTATAIGDNSAAQPIMPVIAQDKSTGCENEKLLAVNNMVGNILFSF